MSRPLGIVLLTRNVSRGSILGRIDASPFPVRYDTIGLGAILHTINAILLAVKPIGLSLIQLSAGDALIDATLLVRLPLIDARGFRLCIGHSRRQQDRAHRHTDLFHDCLLQVG